MADPVEFLEEHVAVVDDRRDACPCAGSVATDRKHRNPEEGGAGDVEPRSFESRLVEGRRQPRARVECCGHLETCGPAGRPGGPLDARIEPKAGDEFGHRGVDRTPGRNPLGGEQSGIERCPRDPAGPRASAVRDGARQEQLLRPGPQRDRPCAQDLDRDGIRDRPGFDRRRGRDLLAWCALGKHCVHPGGERRKDVVRGTRQSPGRDQCTARDARGADHRVVRGDAASEELRRAAVGETPQQVELPDPVLRHAPSERRPCIALALGGNVRDTRQAARHANGCTQRGEGLARVKRLLGHAATARPFLLFKVVGSRTLVLDGLDLRRLGAPGAAAKGPSAGRCEGAA